MHGLDPVGAFYFQTFEQRKHERCVREEKRRLALTPSRH